MNRPQQPPQHFAIGQGAADTVGEVRPLLDPARDMSGFGFPVSPNVDASATRVGKRLLSSRPCRRLATEARLCLGLDVLDFIRHVCASDTAWCPVTLDDAHVSSFSHNL